MTFMANTRGIVMGVANNLSLAWAIGAALAENGADIIFSCQNLALKKRLEGLLVGVAGSHKIAIADVEDEDSLKTLLAPEKPNSLDFLVHAVAWADKAELSGPYLQTSQANFERALRISCYSLTSLARHAEPKLKNGASIVALSYEGARRVIPNYNVMGVAKAALEASIRYLAHDFGPRGIRVNALSAGPARTLAASAIGAGRTILRWHAENAPLRRNITAKDIAGGALYLLSPLSKRVTGEILHIDNGYHAIGMVHPQSMEASGGIIDGRGDGGKPHNGAGLRGA